ncbi:hypothetical protein D9756_005727 [Leucocoprinus leucothites]|uniref:Peroxin domain-containing protein n=1 Tax=Leucocoprinus leucothites TaxID=201217 RepID=A0A8H5D703_9AGAR|nr:hypothetical protein D9756_005727 [Leucoagaricus leucothites]
MVTVYLAILFRVLEAGSVFNRAPHYKTCTVDALCFLCTLQSCSTMDSPPPATSPTLPGSLEIAPSSTVKNLEQSNDARLRETYENEEIERILRLFSTYVNEVKAPEAVEKPSKAFMSLDIPEDEGGPTDPESTPGPGESAPDHSSHYGCLSKQVAYHFLLPLLPPPKTPPQEFTLDRFRLASQRVYLAVVPHYTPFIVKLYRLAKWEDRYQSTIRCAGFWVLWWSELLPAAFFFSLIFILLKHRFLPYPSQSQLKRHREEISHSDKFSEQLFQRLSSPSLLGVGDVWRLGRLFMLPPKEKQKTVKVKAHPEVQAHSNGEDTSERTILEDTGDSDEIQEIKRLGLFLMNEIADFHERIKNIFLWRNPSSSWLYLSLILLLFLGSLLIPARFVLKGVSGALGFLFWHAVPVILALSPDERLRLPPLMLNVPTDTEYAMELISQRVAAGLEINHSKLAKGKPVSAESPPVDSPSSSMVGDHIDATVMPAKGLGKALISGISLLQDGIQFIKEQTGQPEDDTPSLINLINPSPNTHRYPAHHHGSSIPGFITLTPTTFYFSLVTPSITIELHDIIGIKKTGFLNELEIMITWSAPDTDGHKFDKVEKFWLLNRDELFVRMICTNSGIKWNLIP